MVPRDMPSPPTGQASMTTSAVVPPALFLAAEQAEQNAEENAAPAPGPAALARINDAHRLADPFATSQVPGATP